MGECMKKIESLKDIIGINSSFKAAVNLYLSLNKPEKVFGYIPTSSSVYFLMDYLKAVIENKEQASLLVGPYGKGKSHLLLVILAILSMDRTKENSILMQKLVTKIKDIEEIGNEAAECIQKLWAGNKYLPVLISGSSEDLSQSFLYGLQESLKREGLTGIAPETYFSVAIERLEDWEHNYYDTYMLFEKELSQSGSTITSLIADLKRCSKQALNLFKMIYPKVTAGTEFNPLAVCDVLPLYKSVGERLVEDYGYDGLYIVFDEFSKFIESQDGTAAGSNMKLVQDMCELAAESQNARVYFTLVAHKSIKEYGKYLSTDIINSFTGIEGRLIEKFFVTSSKNNYELIRNAINKDEAMLKDLPHYQKILGEQALNEYYQVPAFKSNFQRGDFESIVLKGCYPLKPVAAYLLLNISEKVAQNERTLFTFISNDEPRSMARFIKEHTPDQEWSICADLIYDYFEALFKKEVSNEYVHNVWLSAEYTLGKCFSDDQKRITKALAIVLIVNKEDEIPADEKYLSLCVNADDAAQAIAELMENQLIYKKGSTGTFVFKTKAGAELKSEIKRQRDIKGDNVNVTKTLLDVTGKYYVLPRKYNTIHWMTRYFTNEFMEANDFLNINSAEALLSNMEGDGKVITLYSFTGIKQEQVNRHIEELADSRLVVVCPKRGLKAFKQLKDYEIIQDLQQNSVFTSSNEILRSELPLLLDDLTMELEDILAAVYEEDKDTRVLYYNGEKVKNAKTGNEEKAVNECCEIVYFKTAVINNEMVNRSVIGTAQTRKARVNIIQAILNHEDDENFYAGSNQEATVYRSLFCQTGILSNKPQETISEILGKMDMFIDSCSDKKSSISGLVEELTNAPYGLRAGLVPLYLAYVLAGRREDIIIYFAENEVQLTGEIVVNMCENPSDYQMYISKEDLQKEKYINELNALFDVEDNRNLSSNRIKNIFICMQRWFRSLPQVSRNLVSLEHYVVDDDYTIAMKSMKKALQKIDFNPFEILFVNFPQEFGTQSFEETFKVIDECKTFYDDYFDWIQAEAVKVIYKIWSGKRKQDLYHTLFEWYGKQSKRSKQGLHSGRMTNFMSAIEGMSVFNDAEIALKVIKAVTDVYAENWNVGAIEEFEESLGTLKKEIEQTKDEVKQGELTLTFTDKSNNEVTRLYRYVDESTGSVLRNIIEDALDEFADLSVNDRVSILLEMIERVIK